MQYECDGCSWIQCASAQARVGSCDVGTFGPEGEAVVRRDSVWSNLREDGGLRSKMEPGIGDKDQSAERQSEYAKKWSSHVEIQP